MSNIRINGFFPQLNLKHHTEAGRKPRRQANTRRWTFADNTALPYLICGLEEHQFRRGVIWACKVLDRMPQSYESHWTLFETFESCWSVIGSHFYDLFTDHYGSAYSAYKSHLISSKKPEELVYFREGLKLTYMDRLLIRKWECAIEHGRNRQKIPKHDMLLIIGRSSLDETSNEKCNPYQDYLDQST